MKSIPYIVIALLFIYVIFLKECRKPETVIEERPIYIDSIVYQNDTIIDTVYIPKWITKVEIETDSFIDTVFIIKDYNTKYFYSDVILNDLRGVITVMDTIYQNRIKSRRIDLKLHEKVIYRTKLLAPDKRTRFLYGGGVNGWSDKFGFDVGVGLKFKSDNIGLITYDPINRAVKINYFLSL
jgi:hypothetical protein